MTQHPAVGRIVHYHSYGTPNGEYKPEPRAAIITAVNEFERDLESGAIISLCVINPTGTFFNESVPHSEEPKPGHWSWPVIER